MIAKNKQEVWNILIERNIDPTRTEKNDDTGDITYFINGKEVAKWEYQSKKLSIV